VRDERYPIRATFQFYSVTDESDINDAMFSGEDLLGVRLCCRGLEYVSENSPKLIIPVNVIKVYNCYSIK
jgi:hypothetical protein